MSRPIRTTRQAREARRQARLALLGKLDADLCWLRVILRHADGDWENLTTRVNSIFDRMEYHLDMIEAGR